MRGKRQEAGRREEVRRGVGRHEAGPGAGAEDDLYLALASDFEREAGLFADGLAHAQQAGMKINDKVGAYYVLAAANAYGNQDVALARRSSGRCSRGASAPSGRGPSTPPRRSRRWW